MNLFTNFYISPARQAELDFCLKKNIDNPHIKHIYLIMDRPMICDSKITVIQLSHRPTFKDYTDLMSVSEGTNIIANADIYFDDTLKLAEVIQDNEAYALSRWDEKNGELKHFNTRDSQDAWIINGKLTVTDCDFTQGVAGCDNAFAERLKWAGYKISNPSKDIRSIHVHGAENRIYDATQRVSLPYLLISPHKLGETPILQRLITPYWT